MSFLFLYLEDLGLGAASWGLCLLLEVRAPRGVPRMFLGDEAEALSPLEVSTEVPLMFLMPAAIRRWGERRLLLAALALYAVRMGLYALLSRAPSPALVLAIEPLHGATFALYVSRRATCRG